VGWQTVKITPDTNILLRVIVEDDAKQSRAAEALLARAETVALTLPVLCEFAWVLSRGYKAPADEIIEAIRRLMSGDNVTTNLAAIEAGLDMLENGGDFADGVIAYKGRWLGGETFVSFDKRAAKLLALQGRKTHVPA
jgi:predicted nucleic-acid-binding protein